MSPLTLAELLAQAEALSTQARELDTALSRFHSTKAELGPLDEHLEDAYAGALDAYHLVNQARGALRVVCSDLRQAQRAEALARDVRALGWVWGARHPDKGWRAWRPGRHGEPVRVEVYGHSREQLLAAIAAADVPAGAEVASHG